MGRVRARGRATVGVGEFSVGPLHHVQISVPPGSEERCREFWGELLGMTEVAKPPVLAAKGGCWFRSAELEVHLGVEREFTPAGKAHPGILVSNLDALAERLLAHGRPVNWNDDFPGYRRFHSFDLLGNRLEFMEPEAERTA